MPAGSYIKPQKEFERMKKYLLTLITTLLFSAIGNAQQIAVNTDLAMDALCAPSLGFELTLAKRSTLSLNGFYANGVYGKEIKCIAIQPEWRFYFSGRPMHQFFVGVGALGTTYDISAYDKRYEGDAIGAGLTFGYVLPLTKNKRLLLDFHAGWGMMFYRQKEYFLGDNYQQYNEDGSVKANATGMYTIPTRIGISLAYVLK